MVAPLTIQLKVEKRFWFGPALNVLSVACALVSLVSNRAADVVSELGCTILARFGIVVSTEAQGDH